MPKDITAQYTVTDLIHGKPRCQILWWFYLLNYSMHFEIDLYIYLWLLSCSFSYISSIGVALSYPKEWLIAPSRFGSIYPSIFFFFLVATNTVSIKKWSFSKPRKPQPCAKKYGQLRNTESWRNSLPQRRAHHVVIQYQTISPENICTNNIQTEKGLI